MQKVAVYLFLIVGVAFKANAITCEAQLIHTMCGSGRVAVTIDESAKTFNLNNGDVNCWMADYVLSGTIDKKEPSYPFFSDHEYQLSSIDAEKPNFAEFIYDPELKVASLTLLEPTRFPLIHQNYNLTCKE